MCMVDVAWLLSAREVKSRIVKRRERDTGWNQAGSERAWLFQHLPPPRGEHGTCEKLIKNECMKIFISLHEK